MNDFLSDYNIKETIGKGTFSIVKLGINKKTKEKVAIKILKKKKIIHKEDVERIEREINILKKLDHINVIKIYKINEDDEKYYIVMEFCENGELFHYIVERQRLNEDDASFFFYQLINGLEYIHSENIVHRDLKPENLLLGKNYILKIIDFGLSNFCQPDNFLETPCGSPCYASPEMVCGDKYNGHMIDIWSTGIILFAMLCGYLPFEDPDNDLLFKKILKCKIRYPDYLSDITLDLMKKILVVDPTKRITLEEIKQHPFYLKGKEIFNIQHHNLVKEVEKLSYNKIKKIKSLKFINNEECINNLATSGGVQDESKEEDILNASTKNYNYEDNYNERDTSKGYRRKSADNCSEKNNKNIQKVKKNTMNSVDIKNVLNDKPEIKDDNQNNNDNQNTKTVTKNKKEENINKTKELNNNIKNNEKKDSTNNNVINNEKKDSTNNNINIKNKTYFFNKLIKGLKNKIKSSRPSSTENKNIHGYQTGVLNINIDNKNNMSLLQKLLNNNNYDQNKYFNNKIILSKNYKKNISCRNGNNNKIIKNKKEYNRQKSDSDHDFKNNETEYKNIKYCKISDTNISHSFKSHTISNISRKKRLSQLTPINLKRNNIKNNPKNKKDEIKNNSCNNKCIKNTSAKNIKKMVNMNNKYHLAKNNSNLIQKYFSNYDLNNNNLNKNYISSNCNNKANNICIIKSPIKTTKKKEICFSKQYTMKLNLDKLKSNIDINQDFSTSFNNNNNVNNINNIYINLNQLKQLQLNSITNNNNINFGTSLTNNLNNTNNTKIFFANNDVYPNSNSNGNYTNRNNNFLNHKKLLITTLNKKINSQEKKKISNYLSIPSGEFFKIKKTIISKRHKKNDSTNVQKNNLSNISSNVSRIICNHLRNNYTKNKVNSANKDKRIPLIGLNLKKIKTVKKSHLNNDLITLKRKQQKYSSVDKGVIKKDKTKQLFLNKFNYKKINSTKNSTKIDDKLNASNIFKIKKVNGDHHKSSSTNIVSRKINSGNKTTVNHKKNSKFFYKNIINSGNMLINSYINYSNLHSKKTNK